MQRNRKSLLKIIVCVFFIFNFTCLFFSSCKKTGENEVEVYYEVTLRVSGWCDDGNFFEANLTEENGTFEKDVAFYPFNELCYVAEFRVEKYYSDNRPSGTAIWEPIVGGIPLIDGMKIDYVIEQGEEKTKGEFDYNYFWRKSKTVTQLQKKSGTHYITYHIPEMPKYGTKAMNFQVKLNVGENDTAITPEIVIENEKSIRDSYLLGGVGGYDLYIMTSPPKFVAKSGDEIFDVEMEYQVIKIKETGDLNISYIKQNCLYICRVRFNQKESQDGEKFYNSTSYTCMFLYI